MATVKHTGPEFKIIVLGESAVGKSSLLYKYSKNKPPGEDEIKPTFICDFVPKVLDVEGTEVKLSFWDPSGIGELCKCVNPSLYRKVHSVVFVYDITSPRSFEYLNYWIDECRKNNVELANLPVVLLANKYDLEPIVAEGRARDFAKKHEMMFFKTSSFTDENVTPLGDVFQFLARILKFQNKA